MNARKAKRIRRAAYGDNSLRSPRKYIRTKGGQIINSPGSLRAAYQQLKKDIG